MNSPSSARRITSRVLLGLGVVAIIVGVVFGLLPGTFPECGSLFMPHPAATFDSFGSRIPCGIPINYQTQTIAALVVGVALVVAGLAVLLVAGRHRAQR